MVKQCLCLVGSLLFAFTVVHTVNAETIPEVENSHFTTEDIVSDLVMPTIDKRVIKEYKGDDLFGWEWQRIVGIKYNNNHSYDIDVKINIPSKDINDIEDLVKVRVSPSCDSEKINKQKCNHDFNIEIIDYKHLSR
ncbi:hypothetical protein [Cytobacillus gottheilii]|uniref:hypothetical protein n=1 Tax=Cytobacillus gottheilii TaxID=859144 RepID=UPI0024940E20|nr:hypothetical protein [Cytobacillus gottheilii]